MSDITIEQVQEFMDFLTGDETPEGFTFQAPPSLSPQGAFSVVYYLQERLSVLPDSFEMCRTCKALFDTDHDGFTLDGKSAPDEWHLEHGVTAEMLTEHKGAQFCSEQCEARFWTQQRASSLAVVTPMPDVQKDTSQSRMTTMDPTLSAFLDIYSDDHIEWWRLDSGQHQNLFDALLARAEAAEAEVARLRAVLSEIAKLVSWQIDFEASPTNESPDDMTAHINGLVWQLCTQR